MSFNTFTENVVVYVNSKNRSTGVAENFTINLVNPLRHIRYVEVVSAEIPYTYYNTTTLNNTIVWQDAGATTYAASVAPGNYTTSQFITALQTAMNAQMAGFTITYLSQTYKLQFQNATAFQLNLTNGSGTSTMAQSIGLLANTPLVGTTTNTTLTGVVNLSGPSFLAIRSTALVRPKITRPFFNSNQDYILYKVSVAGSPGDILVEKNLYTNMLKYGIRQNIQSMDFILEDPDGNQIDLNGSDWSITLNFQTSI